MKKVKEKKKKKGKLRARTYGMDLALRHGAMIKTTWDFSEKIPRLARTKVVYEWTAKDGGLSTKSSPLQIRKFCLKLYKEIRELNLKRAPIGIDWDPKSVYWGRRDSAVTLAYFAGYLARTLEILGFPVIFISPVELRRRLGGSSKLEKSRIWALFPDIRKNRVMSSDLKDAAVLSFLVARSMVRDPKKISKTNLSSRKAKRKNT